MYFQSHNKALYFNCIIVGVDSDKGLTPQIEALLSPLKGTFVMALDEEESDDLNVKKIPLYLIETISHLVHAIPFENNVKGDNVSFTFSYISSGLIVVYIYIFILGCFF